MQTVLTIGPEGARLVVGVDTIANYAQLAHVHDDYIQVVTRLGVTEINTLIASLEIAKQLLEKHGVEYKREEMKIGAGGIAP